MEKQAKNRRARFLGLCGHAWLGKQFRKLTGGEKALALGFLEEKATLDKGSFERAVNRMFLDKSEKPKNWALVMELLSCANSEE